MLDQIIEVMFHPFFMLIYGMLAHFARKVIAAQAHQSDRRPCITDYWKHNPMQTIVSLTGALAGFGALYGSPELTKLTAFGIGYMADNLADAVGEQTLKKVAG